MISKAMIEKYESIAEMEKQKGTYETGKMRNLG